MQSDSRQLVQETKPALPGKHVGADLARDMIGPPPPTLTETMDPLPGARRSIEVKGRIIQLDFTRGVAIFLVMGYHYGVPGSTFPPLNSFRYFFSNIGWMGVDLFFVLSGFLVGGLLVRELLLTGGIKVKRFLLRRMFKIWPAYYFYILFQIVLRRHPLGSFVWQNLLNIQNYAGTSLNHTWSLAIEEHFYLVAPLLLLWLYKHPRLRAQTVPILLAVCALVLAGRFLQVYTLGIQDLQWQTHSRLDSLLFGVLMSHIAYSHPLSFERLLQRRVLLAGTAVAGLTFGLLVKLTSPLMQSLGYTLNYLWLAAILMLIYGYRGTMTKTWLYRAIAWVGLYSYGIYLWHLSVREPIVKVSLHLPSITRAPSAFVAECIAAIVLGVLVTKAIEFPMLHLRERLVPR